MLSELIVCYLFMGGVGAGACLVLSVLGLLVPRDCSPNRRLATNDGVAAKYRKLFAPGYVASLVVLVVGIVCLLADAGSLERAMLLFTQPTLSFVSVGAWTLSACVLVVVALALTWLGLGLRSALAFRILAVIAVVVALATATYTGLLLQSLSAVPLWATPWLPVLFALSSLSCGIACVLGMSHITGAASLFTTTLRRLVSADVLVVVLEALVAAVFVLTLVTGVGSAVPAGSGTALALADSVQQLVAGSDAWLFWGGFVLVGLVIPFVLDIVLVRSVGRAGPGLALVAAVCVLVGGCTMRYCVVEVGMHPVLVATGIF